MAERLFGLETEYAFTALDQRGHPVDSLSVLRRMMEIAQVDLRHLPDGTKRGMFLENAARLYIDFPDKPEFSTPEVANPWDAVRYVQAGDRILETLAAEVAARDLYIPEVIVSRCNVDYGGTGSTWGCHESYLHRFGDMQELATQLIPFLVSRIVFTGAGGFNSLTSAALSFTLSPRVCHLKHQVSPSSTELRGIFHTKDEPLSSEGYHRLHILCGESTCSETATWLKVATTALVVALIDAGGRPGDAVRLKLPLAAMRRFAGDAACRGVAKTVHGGSVSALDIQRHYLEQVEAHLDAELMPSWAGEACRRWREILVQLELGPEAVSTTLDWAVKLVLYKARASRAGISWESIRLWNRVVTVLDRHIQRVLAHTERDFPPGYVRESRRRRRLRDLVLSAAGNGPVYGWPSIDVLLRRGGPFRDAVDAQAPFLKKHGLDWDGLGAFLALRNELCEIDVRFAQLGEKGIFAALDRAGALTHRITGVDNIEHAVKNPPTVGRARVRGEHVRRLARERKRFMCDWRAVFDTVEMRKLDLDDPFASSAEWKPWQPLSGDLASIRAHVCEGIVM